MDDHDNKKDPIEGILTRAQLERFHELLSAPMLRFDCGELCSPTNGGMPACCDDEKVVPLLFDSELAWLNERGAQWTTIDPKEVVAEDILANAVSYNRCGRCTGSLHCDRSLRSISCYAYPFEPHVDGRGRVIGLAFVEDDEAACPLIKEPRSTFLSGYVRNALVFWQELLDAVPQELELFRRESRKREYQARHRGKPFRLIR